MTFADKLAQALLIMEAAFDPLKDVTLQELAFIADDEQDAEARANPRAYADASLRSLGVKGAEIVKAIYVPPPQAPAVATKMHYLTGDDEPIDLGHGVVHFVFSCDLRDYALRALAMIGEPVAFLEHLRDVNKVDRWSFELLLGFLEEKRDDLGYLGDWYEDQVYKSEWLAAPEGDKPWPEQTGGYGLGDKYQDVEPPDDDY